MIRNSLKTGHINRTVDGGQQGNIVASIARIGIGWRRGRGMNDKPNDKTLEAIKRHKPAQTFEMRGPDGSKIRQNAANEIANNDKARHEVNRAEKYAKVEKEKIATSKDVEQGTKGRLSKELNKSGKGMEL